MPNSNEYFFPGFSIGSIGANIAYTGDQDKLKYGDSLREQDGTDIEILQKKGTSPHNTEGITLEWENDKNLEISFNPQDVSAYPFLSFRIGNADRSSDVKGLKVGLYDGNDIKYVEIHSISKADKRTDKPHDVHGDTNIDPTKIAMETIRIPLDQFETLGQGVTLSNIQRIDFKFPQSDIDLKKITIDNIMFTT